MSTGSVSLAARLGAVSLALLWNAASASAAIGPGEVVVSAGNSLRIVDPLTHESRLLGDGAVLTSPRRVAFAPDGSLVVGSPTGLVRVDAATEHETLIGIGDYQGALAVEADGNILASSNDILYRVDPGTGVATLFLAESPTFRPSCLGVASDGTIYASDDAIDGFGAVFAIDPGTGTTNAIPLAIVDTGTCLAVDRDDRVIVTNVTTNKMWSVDPSVPSATPIPLATGQFSLPYQLAAADTGLLYVDTWTASSLVVARLDPQSGAESVLLDLGPSVNLIRGIAVSPGQPVGVATVPAVSTFGLGALALLLLGVAMRSLRRSDAASSR